MPHCLLHFALAALRLLRSFDQRESVARRGKLKPLRTHKLTWPEQAQQVLPVRQHLGPHLEPLQQALQEH